MSIWSTENCVQIKSGVTVQVEVCLARGMRDAAGLRTHRGRMPQSRGPLGGATWRRSSGKTSQPLQQNFKEPIVLSEVKKSEKMCLIQKEEHG